ncbi:MAG: cyclase family protein [Kofleriaceae bacterium]
MSWIDVSVPIRDGMVHWPSNPGVRLERVADLDCGASSNVSQLSMGVHTGTHVDAPIHFFANAGGVETIPIEALVGSARVIAIAHPVHVCVEELEAANVLEGERVLFKTRNSPAAWQSRSFVEDAVHISTDAAMWLAERRVQTVGIDYLSVGGRAAKNGRAVHHALMGAGIWIIEGLDLTHAPIGPCDLVCLPLKLVGADGAPARAIVRPTAT